MDGTWENVRIVNGPPINDAFTFSSSMHRNETSRRVMMNAADTIQSTDRCGPRFCKYFGQNWSNHFLAFSTSMRNPDGRAGLTLRYERTESHVLMLRTLLRRKCGKSELRARLDDVKWANSLAYRNRCLNVRSATASRNKKPAAMAKRSTAAVTTIIFSLQKHFLKKSFNFLVFMVLSHNLLHFDDNGNKSNCRMKLPGWGAEEDVTDHRGTVKETIPSWRLDQIQNGSPNGSVDPVNDWQ